MNPKFTKPLDLVDQPIMLENKSNQIVYANNKALKHFKELQNGWEPNQFNTLFTYYGEAKSVCISRESSQLFISQMEPVSINDLVYKKITLLPLCDVPDPMILSSYMEMAEKFVHQFRSPLTGSYGYLEILMEKFTSGEDSFSSYLPKIEKGLDQSFHLLDQIEAFATPVSVESSTFSLNSLILSVFENFSEEEIKHVSIVKPTKTVKINSDYYLLRRIVIELLKNGLEANPDITGKKVLLKFHDEGIIEVRNKLLDFPENNLKRIFFPFFSTKALQMGLGLPKCRLYCHKLHLDLQVRYYPETQDISFQIRGYPYSVE